MGPKRPTPLDLSGVAATPAAPAGRLIDAPEDLDFQPREFRLAERPGAVVAAGERSVQTPRGAPDLPALSEEARAARVRSPRGWPFYLAASVVSLLWALAPIMFAWGYRREIIPFSSDPFALAVLGLLAVGPMALVWLAAYVAHQGARLAAETRRAQILADTLLQPAALAARGGGTAGEAGRREIEQATAAAGQARDELLALREVLAAESRTLVEAAQASMRTANILTGSLGAEREKMGTLAGALDAQAVSVTDAITRHAKMVAEASDLAETQIREAEAALAARAADLAAAAGEASDAARVAGEDLARQVARLETAGQGVGDQVRTVEESLTQQRAALITVAHGLRAEHEAFAAEAETQRAQLAEVLGHAREGASEIDQSAARGAAALRQLIAEAGERLRDITDISAQERAQLSEAAAEERDRLSEAAARSFDAVAGVAASERNALEAQTRETVDALSVAAEQARRAAESHAQTVRDKIDQLGEAAFAAGQRADSAFETRLAEARGLVEQSARMVEDAGARSAAQLAQGVATARETLVELEKLLADVDARIGQLPADAEAGAEHVRASLARGMEELMASARKAAEETQSIDAAFQDRVRRNYDMLSEAVRLMGVVAGAASTAAPPPPPPTRPTPRAPPATTGPEPAAEASAPDDAGLRPRLKLTPTASDDEFKTVFEAAGGREPAEAAGGDAWTWKELLSSMDEAPPSDESLASVLIGEIEAMGVDAAALLPRPRIDEIAASIQAGDGPGALEVVRRLAPAAIRRLSRRMISDRRLRAQAERYVRRHQDLVDEARSRGDGGVVTSALLGSDQGRAFLLLDAALADVA
jgi:hypothetical protein